MLTEECSKDKVSTEIKRSPLNHVHIYSLWILCITLVEMNLLLVNTLHKSLTNETAVLALFFGQNISKPESQRFATIAH